MFEKRKKVRLLLKSGQTIDVTVDKLSVKFNQSELRELSWTDMRPRALFLDLGQVVAVFEL
jgi:hypothetical protein